MEDTMPRKYTKFNYVEEMNQKLAFWRSIYQQILHFFDCLRASEKSRTRFAESARNAAQCRNRLHAGTGLVLLKQDKALADLYAALSEKIAEAVPSDGDKLFYGEIQQKVQEYTIFKEELEKFFETTKAFTSNVRAQEKRTAWLENLIAVSKETIKKEETFASAESKIQRALHALVPERLQGFFASKQVRILKKQIKQNEKCIDEIKKGLYAQSKAIVQRARELLPESKKEACITDFSYYIRGLGEDARLAEARLRELAEVLKNFREQYKASMANWEAERAAQGETTQQDVMEQIRSAVQLASGVQQGVILTGKCRTIGLSYDVLEEFEGERYEEDILEQIEQLLETSFSSGVVDGGSSRWKKLKATNGKVVELSVSPKEGNSQEMPRIYFKKCVVNMNEPEEGQTKKTGTTKEVWVAVKIGSKGDQRNDMMTASKINPQDKNPDDWLRVEVSSLQSDPEQTFPVTGGLPTKDIDR